jgi:hypothetical protein
MGDSMSTIINATTTNGVVIQPDNSGSLVLQTNNGTTALTIDTSQNVGIGTSSPTQKLDVTNGRIAMTEVYDVRWLGSGSTIRGSISADSGSNLYFGTGSSNTERMRIDSSGNVLVGTTDSSGTSGGGIKIKPDTVFGANTLNIVGAATSNSFQGYYLYSTGASAARFYVGYGGTIFATSTSITAISDESLKENVRDLDVGLNEVMALKPRRFDWKEETEINEKNVAGFIAQEVADVLPELVYDYQYNETETKKALKMGDMLPTLVKAIQEQQTIINDLKARVEALEAK